MNRSAVIHRSNSEYTYAADNDTVIVKLRTGKDIDKAYIISEDPFIHELNRKREWYGIKQEMEKWLELTDHFIWKIKLKPQYKRLQYYFELECEGENYYLYENRLCKTSESSERSKQYFKFPWLNPSDVITPPSWVEKTVWYQIMPERFSRDKNFENNGRYKEWGNMADPHLEDLYGGNLRGITERLPYLKDLGVGGIYMTPVFHSPSSHKYNTINYTLIDPGFGTDEDMVKLVETAHSMGMRVMLDAVFNHCGNQFAPWKDVQKNGRNSPYYDWFFVNGDNIDKEDYSTADGRFYSFSFWAGMPKFNTNNPEVIDYFTDITSSWVRNWGIDGIRFDVGDEVSHTFLRSLYNSLKAISPDIYLLGEIWNDSLGWVTGREYDAVMNYPLSNCINDFWKYPEMNSTDFMYYMNYCRSLYPEQSARAMFNFLDTHDTSRAIESCKNKDVLLQKLTALITLPGTPCIYYGTEIAMNGLYAPFNRRCMPWDEIDSGMYKEFSQKVSSLIKLREKYPALSESEMQFIINEDEPRLISYIKDSKVKVWLNAAENDVDIPDNIKVCYSNLYDTENKILHKDGILVAKLL